MRGEKRRIHTLDILRGLALCGMILVHFHQRMRLEVGGAEGLIGWAVYVLVEQKAWGAFAFLFGVGFAVLLSRLEARGEAVAPIYLRRLGALAVFGVIAEVGFGFTILFSYAVWGVALLVIRHWPSRALLMAAALAAMAGPLTAEVGEIAERWLALPSAPNSASPLIQAVEAAATGGSYAELLLARWRLFLATTPGGWSGLLPDTNLALFIVGLLAVRHGVIDDPLGHERTIRRWMLFGAVSWAAFWAMFTVLESIDRPGLGWPIAMGLGLVRDQWLCFTYVGAVMLLLAHRPEWNVRLRPIAGAGRMALTNYMLQIAVLDVLASGYGLGLKIRPLLYVPATLVLFGIEIVISQLWLARFRYGPLERCWRVVTYGPEQPEAGEEKHEARSAPIA